jgi:hypothetical protein
MVDSELAPVMNVGDGVVDDAQRTTATSNPWSLTTGTSRGDGEGWLVTTAASVFVGGLEKLHENAGQAITPRSREKGEGGGARGEKGGFTVSESTVTGCGNCELRRAIFQQPGGSESRGEGRRKERGCWAL